MKIYSTRNSRNVHFGEYVLSVLAVLFLIAIAVGISAGVSLATIWAINTLFPAAAIPYTIWTVLAGWVILLVSRFNVVKKEQK